MCVYILPCCFSTPYYRHHARFLRFHQCLAPKARLQALAVQRWNKQVKSFLHNVQNTTTDIAATGALISHSKGKAPVTPGKAPVTPGKAPVTPGLRPGYEPGMTERGGNRGGIAERAYHWS